MPRLRVLLLADTHVGFDDPRHPRVERRRRGPDFLAAFDRALEPARRGEVDLVVHGGDLLHRSRAPSSLVLEALAPLRRVAALGVPVFLVPGNHERGRIPLPLFQTEPDLHVFREPSTVTVEVAGQRVAVSGMPFMRRSGDGRFPELVEATRWREHAADVRLLCLHAAFEGARVGVQEYVFRRGTDVVPGREIPRGFAAVLCGHIHRGQVLTHDLQGRALAAPVLYPGSVERTSFAEREEPKGTLVVEIEPSTCGGRMATWRFEPLPARPMLSLEVDAQGLSPSALDARLRTRLARCPGHAVVRLDVRGAMGDLPSAAHLRALAPPTMNVSFARPRG